MVDQLVEAQIVLGHKRQEIRCTDKRLGRGAEGDAQEARDLRVTLLHPPGPDKDHAANAGGPRPVHRVGRLQNHPAHAVNGGEVVVVRVGDDWLLRDLTEAPPDDCPRPGDS